MKVETRSGRFMRYRFCGDLFVMRSTGMMWSYMVYRQIFSMDVCTGVAWEPTLSSSSVDAERESRVTRMANCFLVPLSRNE